MSETIAPNTTRSWVARVVPWGVGAAWWLIFAWGWSVREERYLSAEFGLGYQLGIAGLACMIALLLYSVRKRSRWMREAGSIRRWLSVHILLGLGGPLCVLFHADFRLGSLNSSVSLACVLLVAGSGVIGRVIYPRIHNALSGQRATLNQVKSGVDAKRQRLSSSVASDEALVSAFHELELLALGQAPLPRLFGRIFVLRRRSRALRRRPLPPAALRALGDYLGTVQGVLRFRIYERLFGLWHAFHLPLCFLLFGAAAVHVVAVHLY
jgi:hypothetical protein